jgi:alpha-glucosidase
MLDKMPADREDRTWWRDGVLYQIYPRSYMDTNGDGIGDLRGVEQRLDHLQWLGIDAIWLDPITVSPNEDWGYDVSNYKDVDPALGTLADADSLIEAAAARGIKVVLDIVPNHTSDQHPWFGDARASKDSTYRDWYVFRDGKPDGSPPNNWVNVFHPGRPAWTKDEQSGQYFLNHFLPSQPDLNWWNDGVRDEFDDILRFWFDRGVAGFRIDVCHMIVKDKELRDNPPSTDADHWYVQLRGQQQVYNSGRPEVHDILRRWRKLADSYERNRILVGETYVFEPELLAEFYGAGDEVNLAFNLMFLHSQFDAEALRDVVETAERVLPDNCWPTWTAGNHDNRRFPTRWAGGDSAKARAAMVMMLGLRGTPFLYYGDEIGMPDTEIPDDRILDPVARYHGSRLGRDPERTPMHWSGEAGGGFTSAGVEPWLPFGDYAACNVADQRHDPDSMLSLTRDLISLRDAIPQLRRGDYATLPCSAAGLWAWNRGERALIACNLSDGAATVPDVDGAIRLSTTRARDAESVSGSLHLDPWEAAIVWRS